MLPRVLLFGRNGQLGWELERALSVVAELAIFDFPAVNFNQPQTLAPLVRETQPQFVINAVAYTNVDKAESEPEAARRVNAESVGELAKASAALGAPFLHISTDFVFDGTKSTPYIETDAPNPISTYGATKLLGDEMALAFNPRTFVLRPAWVYSNRTGGFVNKVLGWARTNPNLRIVDDQVSSPTWCRALAEVIAQLVGRHASQPESLEGKFGLYHAAGAGECSRYEWVREIISTANLSGVTVSPAKTEEFPAPAARPAYSPVDSSKLTRELGLALPAWQVSLRHCLE